MSRMGTFSANIDGVTVTVRASSRRVAINKIVAKTGKHLSEVKSNIHGSGASSGHHSGQKSKRGSYVPPASVPQSRVRSWWDY